MAEVEKRLVLSLFADEAAADSAVDSLKAWDELEDDVKLNAIGTMVLDEHGKLKVHKVGRLHDFAEGAGVGVVVVILAGYVFSPLLPPLAVGLYELHHKNVRVTPELRARLSAELTNCRAAVAVLVPRAEAAAVSAKLEELGGSSEGPVEIEITPELDAAAAKAGTDAGLQAVI